MKLFLKKPIYRAIKNRVPEIYSKDYKKRVNKEYREIIERTEGVGGKENPMEVLLYFLFFLISIYKCSDGKMSEDNFKFLIDELGKSSMMRKTSKLSSAFSKKNIKTLENIENMVKEQRYKNNWVATFEYNKENQEYFMDYRECAFCKITKYEGVFNIAKYLCKIDYYMYRYKNTVLDRTKTLAYGDDCCNFHVMSKKRADEINFVESKNAK